MYTSWQHWIEALKLQASFAKVIFGSDKWRIYVKRQEWHEVSGFGHQSAEFLDKNRIRPTMGSGTGR